MGAFADSDALHVRVRAMVRAFTRGEVMPEPFDGLAADVARFQAAHVPGYRRLCAARGVRPECLEAAEQAPAVPADAFRVGHVFAFAADVASTTFRTSGTTLGTRGEHRMRTVETYDAAALAFGRAMLAPDIEGPSDVLVLCPPPAESVDSSLSHMCALFARHLGAAEPPERTFFIRRGALDVDGLRGRIEGLSAARPAIVLATTFALAALVDALGQDLLPLPPASRVMQTGGFKGKAREVPMPELLRAVSRIFGLDPHAVVSEYGMTELSSQFWEPLLATPGGPRGVFVEPPWARVVPVDPGTLEPVGDGEVGMARIEDLANVDSAFAILTQDRVRRIGRGFELLGRLPGAAPRGCSIAVEEMLSAGAASDEA